MSDKPTYKELEQRVRELERAESERKRAEQELESERIFLSAVLDSIEEAIVICDQEGRLIRFNEAARRLHGLPVRPIPPDQWAEYYDLYEMDGITPLPMEEIPLFRALQGEHVQNAEIVVAAKHTGPHSLVCSGQALTNEKGSVTGAVVAMHDITDRKRAEEALRESNERLNQLAEQSRTMVWEVDKDGLYTYVNHVAEQVLGYRPEEIVGKMHFYDLHPEEGRETFKSAAFEVFVRKAPFIDLENRVQTKSGEILWVSTNGIPVLDGEGSLAGYRGSDTEITERRRAEEALRESEQRYRTILESIADGYYEVDLAGNLTFFNDSVCKLLGYSRDELMGMNNRRYTDEHVAAELFQAFNEVYRTGMPTKGFGWEVIPRDQVRRFVEASVTLIQDTKGRPLGFRGIVRDVTDRRRVEEELRESRNLLRGVFESIQDGISVLDQDLTIRYANNTIKTWHQQEKPLEGKKCFQAYQNRTEPCLPCPTLRCLKSREMERAEVSVMSDQGEKAIELFSYPLIEPETNNVTGAVEFMRDITERKRAEDALKRSHNRLLTILDSIDATIYVADINTHEILFMNKNMIDSFGRDFTGEICWEVFRGETGPCPDCTNNQLIDKRGKPTGVIVWQGRNPVTRKWYVNYDRAIEWTDGRLVRIEIASDITKLKEMEDQLHKSQKMEAIGTLAGGIAHNFNNVLMGIQGRASLMMMDKSPSHPDYEHLKGIKEYVRSATELTRDLLGFARGGKYEVRPVDLNQLIKNESTMFGRTNKEIRVNEKYEDPLWTVEADPGQIRQALLNLYVNAWQAMPGGGDLYVQTKNVILDEEYCRPFEINPGRYVKVSVTDTGTGMDDATRERIFDPFFSTKNGAQGSGLGLASVYGIIKNHGGFINVYSEKGTGTTFNLYLPASMKKAVEKAPIPDRREIKYGRGTVLIVDDEDMILEVGRMMLEKLGYQVLVAGSGQEALGVYGEQKKEIDLVILDMIMPGMGGGEVFDNLREMDRNVKVILSSGYSINGLAKEIMDRGCRGFIQKPFAMEELSRRVKEALD